MLKLNLFDSCFGDDNSISSGATPEKVQYLRGADHDPTKYNLYTNFDMYIQNIKDPERSFGWLYESSAIIPEAFNLIHHISDRFKYIYTHDQTLCKWDPKKFKYSPPSGIWISTEPNGGGSVGLNHPKRPGNKWSMLTSPKNYTHTQKLRLNIADRAARMGCEVFGRETRIPHVFDAIAPYKFSLAVENAITPGYFTEKLLNCMVVGTIPIYLGCPNIGEFFETSGILSVEDVLSGKVILNDALYESMQFGVHRNYEQALKYKVPEDYLYNRYWKEFVL